jgi:hypothetical protein
MFHLVKVSDAKQPAIGVALLTAAKFSRVYWTVFLEGMMLTSVGFSMETMAGAA